MKGTKPGTKGQTLNVPSDLRHLSTFTETESGTVAAGSRGRGKWGVCVYRTEFQFRDMKNLQMDAGEDCTAL